MTKPFHFLFHLAPMWALGGDEVSLLLLEIEPHRYEGQRVGQVWHPIQRIGQSRSDVLAALADRDIEILPEALSKLRAAPEVFWSCR